VEDCGLVASGLWYEPEASYCKQKVSVLDKLHAGNFSTSWEIVNSQEDILFYIVSTYLSLSSHLFYYFIPSYSLFSPPLLPSFLFKRRTIVFKNEVSKAVPFLLVTIDTALHFSPVTACLTPSVSFYHSYMLISIHMLNLSEDKPAKPGNLPKGLYFLVNRGEFDKKVYSTFSILKG
jgi:hypothetical protein